MKLTGKKAGTAAILAAVLCIALIFGSGILNRQRVWTELPYTRMTFAQGASGEERSYSLGAGDSYGVYGEGPGMNLPEGSYRLKWRIEGDGTNIIRLKAENGARIEPSEFETVPGERDGEAVFTIEDAAAGFEIETEFAAGTGMQVLDYRLYSPEYTDDAWTAAFLIAGILLLYLLRNSGWLNWERAAMLLIAGFAVLTAGIPCLKENHIVSYDTGFHAARIMNLAEGLAEGQFPVRLGAFSYDGYGAVTSVFYPDLLLYPFALMMLGGASLTYVMNFLFLACSAFSALTMYLCGRRIFGSRETGLCASVLYTLSLYRLCNLYSRCAVGEAMAMILLPLFLLGLWEAIEGRKERWPLLALSAAAIFLCHLISTLLAAGLAVLVCLCGIRRLFTEKRIFALVKAVLCAAALCMWVLVPFAVYSMEGLGASSLLRSCADNALAPAQLFLWAGGDLAVSPLDTQMNDLAVVIGLPLLAGMLLTMYMAVSGKEKEKRQGTALLYAVLGAVFAFAATRMFPWSYLAKLTARLSDYIQFPFRMLGISCVLLSLCAAYGFLRFFGEKKEYGIFAVLMLSVIFALPLLTEEARSNDFIGFGEITTPSLTYEEYTLPGTDVRAARSREPEILGNMNVSGYRKEGSRITLQVSTEEGGEIAFPVYGYDGYTVRLNGEKTETGLDSQNRLTAFFPAGSSGEVSVRFEEPGLWRIAELISLLTAAGMAFFGLRRRHQVKKGTIPGKCGE